MSEKLIEKANREVDIFKVLEEFFDIRHPSEGKSWKGYCPFGFEHPDGGVDKGWRTYPATNSSYCFVMHGYLTPVRLIQIQTGRKAAASAKYLLEHYGLLGSYDWRERFQEISADRAQRQNEPLGAVSYVVEALNMSLEDHPAYESEQYKSYFAEALEAELGRLDQTLSVSKTTEEDIRRWLQEAKANLLELLDDA